MRITTVLTTMLLGFLLSVTTAHAEPFRTDALSMFCDAYVAGVTSDGEETHYADQTEAVKGFVCLSYVRGIVDESEGESWSLDSKDVLGRWESDRINQVIRVFLKFVADNPEMLNKPAHAVVLASAIKAGLYRTHVAAVPLVPSNN